MRFLKRQFVPAVLAAVLLLAFSPLVPTARADYADAENTWAAEVVEKAAAYGLMEGRPDGTFGVGVDMTRAEFVTVLCRMFAWEVSGDPAPIHPDCEGHWALPYIDAAARHGVEDNGGVFRPDDYISRMEMAQMLVQALGYDRLARSLSDVDLPFPDVTEDRGCAAIAYDFGIITGMEENGVLKFLPSFSATREQCAAMLVRCYERLQAGNQWLHGFYAFSSYSQLSYTAAMDGVSLGWARLEVDEEGTPLVNSTAENGNDWAKPEQSDLVTDYLLERSIPYNLNVFGSAATFAAITEASAQTQAVAALVSAAQPYAGLTMDVEGLRTEHREGYAAFMSQLRAALPADKTLYVCVQPDTWFGGFDYRALGESCDKMILMAHDYQWSSIPEHYVGTDKTYCPVTPIDQIYTALRHITDPDTGVQDKGKLALAISFNTTGFHVDENGLLLDQTFYHPASATIAQRLQQEDSLRVWDDQSRNPNLYYAAEGEHYRLWYEDAQSVAEKLRLARMFGVTGVSVWRLGMIPDYPDVACYDVWSVLSQRA